MPETESGAGAKISPAGWIIAGVAVALCVVVVTLVARAALVKPARGGDSSQVTTSQTATSAASGAATATPGAAPAEPGAPGADTAPVPAEQALPGARGGGEPEGGAGAGTDPANPSARVTGLTPTSARDVVGRLLSAVHDANVSAGQRLVTEDFLSGVGGAEWLGAGPDALISWSITDSVAEDGVVWVTAVETWDYGSQNTRYMVILSDGKVLVDAAEWGL